MKLYTIPANPQWKGKVRQLEKAEEIAAGKQGVHNKPTIDLANMTGFLKKVFGPIKEVV